MLFRQMVFYALLAGVLSGLALTAVQMFQVVPIILAAEQYESTAVEFDGTAIPAPHVHDHHRAHDHHHAAEGSAWAPADGMQRTAFTAIANMLTAMGFALVLMAAMIAAHSMSLRGRNLKFDWKQGLLWGAAGYVVFWLAPAIGLPPEIPMQAAAPLEYRQLWWIFAVLCTAGGLAGLVLAPSPWRWVIPVLLIVPHIVGAPHPTGAMFPGQTPTVAASLEQLVQQFVGATAIANGVLWLVLGLVSAWSVQRMIISMKQAESSDPDAEAHYSV